MALSLQAAVGGPSVSVQESSHPPSHGSSRRSIVPNSKTRALVTQRRWPLQQRVSPDSRLPFTINIYAQTEGRLGFGLEPVSRG